jgi:PAT family beta-lactamase induction signal transducer AmpG
VVARHAGAWKPLVITTFRELVRPDSLKLIVGLFLLGSIYGTYLGVLFFGYIAERLTPRRSMMIGGLGMALLAMTFIAASAYWGSRTVMIAYVLVHLSMYLLVQISLCSIAMGRCNPAVSATQFTLYMATSNMGISAAAAFLGVLDALGGLDLMYAAIVLAGVLICVAGIVFRSAYVRDGET